jgi:hypothetical protein
MKIVNLTNFEFCKLIELLKENGIEYPEDNQFAFTVIIDDCSIIVYNIESEIDNDLKQIVIQHERAHTRGILNEEEADKWALNYLNKKQKKMLIDEWEKRHGHEYKK